MGIICRVGDTHLVSLGIFEMVPVLGAEEALSSLTHLVVALHHIQQDTLLGKLLALEHVSAAEPAPVTTLCSCWNHKYPAPLLQQLKW